MRMQSLLKVSNKIQKSHALLIGSFLIFIGIISLTWNYFVRMRDEVYSDMKIAMMDDVPVVTPSQEDISAEILGIQIRPVI